MKTPHPIKQLLVALGVLLPSLAPVFARNLDLPPRPADAMTGSAFARKVMDLTLQQREEAVFAELVAGNVPTGFRTLVPVTVRSEKNTNSIRYFVTSDYLAIGSDDDYLLMPLTPFTAQRVADRLHCSLPTPRMVNQIYSNAVVKLTPSPLTPGPTMVTIPFFLQHNEIVRKDRDANKSPAGSLTAGHKKDIVISTKLVSAPSKVAIYGWHKPDGSAIQGLFTGHTAAWADYSHGVRLVENKVTINGVEKTLDQVLADPAVADLLSNEGPMKQPRYVFSEFPKDPMHIGSKGATNSPAGAEVIGNTFPGEEVTELKFEPQVRIQINKPAKLDPKKKLLLVFYTLPNGNSIEQTVGKELKPGDDWHFNIQHIGAQTRFLREKISDRSIVVVYLENELKTWPAWRKKYGDSALPKIIDFVKDKFKGFDTKIVLAGHSGGGSFIFGYLNTQDKIPADLERIAFLDANYGYETALHHDKIATWLKASDQHFLNVLAYHDDIALLNGKTFVSAAGGTWGKTHLMLTDFEKDFPFTRKTDGDLETVTGLNGRMRFLLMENPEKKILHTVQVERNGFIQIMVAGTPLEGKDYKYFGDRVYEKFIQR